MQQRQLKLAIFGATGHTGKYILRAALDAGHSVTVLVRDKTKVADISGLKVIEGDALNPEDVLLAVDGQDAVISAISEGPDIRQKIQSTALANIVKAMEQQGVQRLICMGAVGILQFNAGELVRDQPFYPELYRPLSFEHSAVFKMLQTTRLQWTQVCPPTILAAHADGRFVVKADYPPNEKMEVNAGNIASFMMQELLRNEFVEKRVGINNA